MDVGIFVIEGDSLMIVVKELDYVDMFGSINSYYDELLVSIIYMYYVFDEFIFVLDILLGYISICIFIVCSNLIGFIY